MHESGPDGPPLIGISANRGRNVDRDVLFEPVTERAGRDDSESNERGRPTLDPRTADVASTVLYPAACEGSIGNTEPLRVGSTTVDHRTAMLHSGSYKREVENAQSSPGGGLARWSWKSLAVESVSAGERGHRRAAERPSGSDGETDCPMMLGGDRTFVTTDFDASTAARQVDTDRALDGKKGEKGGVCFGRA